MTSGIYLIRCQETGKVYVGSSRNIETRWNQHKQLLAKGKHHSIKLQNAWNKYGENKFEFLIVEEVVDGILPFIEQAWINKLDAFKSGFNGALITGGGYRDNAGRKSTWRHGKTKAVKLPIALAGALMRFAKAVDGEANAIALIEEATEYITERQGF